MLQYHLRLVCLYLIPPHSLINITIFGKTFLNIKRVYWFSLHLLAETVFSLRIIQPEMFVNVHMC